ncbi:hypothetical protein [Plasmodium yoelii yoelii]|uniref:Uncharacterized protein n=1 Tax=Plasmodium yoelii yoelii TaxID=73239 RepID=Q7RSN7_PLAYO|nr:hypothetical protein [Plasmodium yoelii yoelii]
MHDHKLQIPQTEQIIHYEKKGDPFFYKNFVSLLQNVRLYICTHCNRSLQIVLDEYSIDKLIYNKINKR